MDEFFIDPSALTEDNEDVPEEAPEDVQEIPDDDEDEEKEDDPLNTSTGSGKTTLTDFVGPTGRLEFVYQSGPSSPGPSTKLRPVRRKRVEEPVVEERRPTRAERFAALAAQLPPSPERPEQNEPEPDVPDENSDEEVVPESEKEPSESQNETGPSFQPPPTREKIRQGFQKNVLLLANLFKDLIG